MRRQALPADPDAWNQVLRQIIALAGEERDLRALLRHVAQLVVESTGADVCFVHVVDHDAEELVLMGATPDEFDRLAGTIRLPLGEGVAGWVAAHGISAAVPDKWSDPRYRYIPALRGEEYSSLVSVPLRRPPGTVVGVLNAHAQQPDYFDGDVVSRLEEVAGLLAGFVEGAVLLDRLRRRERDLEAFAARTVELQELDRRRIAGDIHDGISQRLVSACYHLNTAIALTGDATVKEQLSTASRLLVEALEDSRRAISGLRPTPLDDLGLPAAISSVASDLAGLDVRVDVADCTLPTHVETAIFRITQEALQNVVKHSGASLAEVRLTVEGTQVKLIVTDNGIGFEPATAGSMTSYGLSGMQERAALLGGELTIKSALGSGTAVCLTIPRGRT